MILYDWRKINRAANRKASEIIFIFSIITYNRIPKDFRDPVIKYSERNFTGQSFMKNPELLLESTASDKEKAQYIALASLRNLADYITFKTLTLDLINVPVRTELFINNQLLAVKSEVIHFKLEET